jgi:hypothetical protein
MAVFRFQNHQDEDVELLIEPWAIAEIVAPSVVVEFEVNDAPPPEIEFCLTESGQPYVYVMSEEVHIRVGGNERHCLKTEFRPSTEVFRRYLRKPFHAS